jgi:hypothetical protein
MESGQAWIEDLGLGQPTPVATEYWEEKATMPALSRSLWQFRQRFASLPMRLLLGVVVAIGALFAWLGYRAHSQRVIVAAIEQAGGKVWYDFDVPDNSAVSVSSLVVSPSSGWVFYAWEWIRNLPQNLRMGPSSGPRWLLDWLGPDYFGHVAWVSLTSRARDADLVQVGRLGYLERLDLHNSGVTGAGLAQLKNLSRLHTLALVRTKIGDSDMVQLKSLSGLRVLSLEGTNVGDQGLSELMQLTELEDLDLASTSTSDAGLAHLRNLTKLQVLNLTRTSIRDAGLVHLAGLANLRELTLSRTSVGDAGVANLKGADRLTGLWLDRTRVTDGGLTHLRGLQALSTIDLSGTRVSDSGVAALSGLPSLIDLTLENTRVTDAGVTELQIRRMEMQAESVETDPSAGDAGAAAHETGSGVQQPVASPAVRRKAAPKVPTLQIIR